MKLAAEIGININDFWAMTPREFDTYVDGYTERLIRQKKNDLEQAYAISRWVWAKRIDLDGILTKLDRPTKQQPMSDKELWEQVVAMNKALGGDVIE